MASPEGQYGWTVKVGGKGQFVIPKEAREILIAIVPKDMFAQLATAVFSQNRTLTNDERRKRNNVRYRSAKEKIL